MGTLITVMPLSANSCPPAVSLNKCGDDRVFALTEALQCYYSIMMVRVLFFCLSKCRLLFPTECYFGLDC